MDGDVNTELTTLVAINMFARVPYQVSTALSDSGPEMLGTVENVPTGPSRAERVTGVDGVRRRSQLWLWNERTGERPREN